MLQKTPRGWWGGRSSEGFVSCVRSDSSLGEMFLEVVPHWSGVDVRCVVFGALFLIRSSHQVT